jgi:hypothetical protein
VALVVIRHVVDVDRRQYFGLDDLDPGDVSPERMNDLYEQYKRHDVTDEPAFDALADRYDLDKTSLNRLRRVLTEQLDDGLPAFGRNPHRDPHLPDVTERDVPDAVDA